MRAAHHPPYPAPGRPPRKEAGQALRDGTPKHAGRPRPAPEVPHRPRRPGPSEGDPSAPVRAEPPTLSKDSLTLLARRLILPPFLLSCILPSRLMRGARTVGEKVALPDGLEVSQTNVLETYLRYAKIFETSSYLKHGLTLEPRSCVFDVGANIGLTALSSSGPVRMCGSSPSNRFPPPSRPCVRTSSGTE